MFCRSRGQQPSACWKALSRCRRFCSRLYSCLMLCRICSETKKHICSIIWLTPSHNDATLVWKQIWQFHVVLLMYTQVHHDLWHLNRCYKVTVQFSVDQILLAEENPLIIYATATQTIEKCFLLFQHFIYPNHFTPVVRVKNEFIKTATVNAEFTKGR